MSRSERQPSILAEVAEALSWPPAEYGPDCDWCANCAYPLNRTDHHQNCLGYIVSAPGLPLCNCPCTRERRRAAANRAPDPLRDQPRWWLALAPPPKQRGPGAPAREYP